MNPRWRAQNRSMRNDMEYFACASTTYLFGVTAHEPFNREKLKERQPAFSEYLERLFGPSAGTFKGSLTR
jgi:hypothetical protein